MAADTFVDLDNARVEEQKQVMQKIIAEGHCPFCSENLFLYHQQPILKEGTYWIITPNQWPYENTKYHFLAILRTHAESLRELPAEAGAELIQLCGELDQEMDLPGGALALRFGDTKYSAGTVKHLHAQLIVPAAETPNFKPTRFKIGKDSA